MILKVSGDSESKAAIKLVRSSGLAVAVETSNLREAYTPTLKTSFGAFSGLHAIAWVLQQISGMVQKR